MIQNIKHNFSILFSLIFFFIFISSLLIIAKSVEMKFEHLTMKDGLASNNVYCILQDSHGFMWFGTESGIEKYDGYTFINYHHDPWDSTSLSDNWVTDIQEDKFGNIWIGTQKGLNKLDQVTGKIERYTHDPNNTNSIRESIIGTLYIDEENNLWIGTVQGLDKLTIEKDDKNNKDKYHFKNYRIDNTKEYSYSNVITEIYEDKDGLLWIGTMNGLYSFDRISKTFMPYLYDPENPNSISGNHITSIYEDKNKNLWIGTRYVREFGSIVFDRSGLLNKYNRSTKRFIRFEKNDEPFCISYVSSIVEDQSEKLWFGAIENHGLYRYEEKSSQFIRFGHNQKDSYSLSSNMVTDLFIDRSGILWIATIHGGINRYDPNKEKFAHFKYTQGKANWLNCNNITRIIEDSFGKVWIGTWGKKTTVYDPVTNLFDEYTFILYYKEPNKDPKHLSWPWVKDVYEDNSKNIWIGTTIGLNKYDRVTNKFKKYFNNPDYPNDPNFISEDYINCIYQDRNDYLWIGTNNGLNRMNIKEEIFKHYFYNPQDSISISSSRIHCIYEDKSGDLWFGSFGGGLNLYDRHNDHFRRYFHNQLDKYSLSDNRITVITEDKTGILWIGTMKGLNKFDKETQKFTLFTTKDGLCNNYIVGIIEDDNGNLWISTKNGLSKFNTNDFTFRSYDTSDGLQNNEFNKLSYHKGQSGRFYFGGINGFNMFYPDSIKDNPYIPPVLITSIKVSNKPIELIQSIFETKIFRFPYYQNDISFDFVSLSYTNSFNNQYAYRLRGYDESWNYCGTQRFANYTNLDHGEYIFQVKGSNNDGVWNEEGTSIKIIILPPWWQTWWFRFLAGLFIFGILGLIYNNRVSSLRKRHQAQKEFSRKLIESQEKERKRIASALHDGHGQNLLIISNEMQQYVKKHQKSESELKNVTDTVQESINEIREIAYDLHPHQLERVGLSDAIDSMISKVCKSTEIQFDLIMDDLNNLFDKKVEINLYRIIQEAVNNIVKHSLATEAKIEIKKKNKYIIFQISDNGIGFNKTDIVAKANNLGIISMKERVNLINGKFKLETRKGKGTTIYISIPKF
jgi:ligand-binding sensor domain-containing protein/signal transduction histidine kinase